MPCSFFKVALDLNLCLAQSCLDTTFGCVMVLMSFRKRACHQSLGPVAYAALSRI